MENNLALFAEVLGLLVQEKLFTIEVKKKLEEVNTAIFMSSHALSLILYKLYIYDSKFPTLYIGHGALLSSGNLHVRLHKYTVVVQIVPHAVDTY